jgi:hypothetical protein
LGPLDVWARSLDERLIKYETGVDLDGYVWGVNSHIVYQGMKLLPPSPETDKWSADIGIPFREAVIETNAHNIGLVFSDLVVAAVQTGYTPFVVPDGGPDFKIPFA